MVTLAKQMQNQIDYARKEARVASMERVTQLEDELRRERQMAGEKVAEIARLNERVKLLEGGGSRLGMMIEESMKRSRSC